MDGRAPSVDVAGAGIAELGRQRREELRGQRGDLPQQHLEHAVSERGEQHWRDGAHGHGSGSGVEQGQFSKVSAWTQLVDLPLAAQDGSSPFEHDEERLPLFSLAHDVCAFGGLDDFHMAGHDPEISCGAASEQRHCAKALDGGGA